MAQREIGFSIKINNENNLKRIDELVQKIQKESNIKLNIATGEGLNSLKAMKSTLDAIEKSISTAFNVKSFNTSGIKKTNEEVDKVKQNIKQVSELSGKIKNESLVKVNDEDIKKITNVNKSLYETQKRVENLQTGTITDTFTTNYEKQEKDLEKLQSRIQSMQSSMGTKDGTNGLINNSLIDESVIYNIQNRLNSINTNTAESEIVALENEIKNLGSTESQIVRVQNKITSMNTNLEGMKGKYGSLVGDDKSIKQLTNYTNKIKDLEDLLIKLKNGESFDGATISKNIGQATNSARELSNAVKNSANAFKLGQQDANNFTNAIRRTFASVGMYTSVYEVITLTVRALKEGISTVIELESAMANLNKVVAMSKTQLEDMKQSAIDMAKEYGTSITSVAESQAESGRIYKDAESIKKLTEASLVGANIMDNTTSAQVSKSLSTVMTAMKMDINDTMTILDSMNEVKCVPPYAVMCIEKYTLIDLEA